MSRSKLPLLSALLLVTATTARAASFDADGRLHTDDTAFALSFDRPSDLPADLAFTVYDLQQSPLSSTALATRFVADPDGLEGKGALGFGGDTIYATMKLAPLPSTLEGRRVAYSVWQKARGTEALLDIYVYVGDYETASSTGDYTGIGFAGMISFRPTGRVTSDGWREWSTGPVDFQAGGVARPSMLTISDAQLATYQSSYNAGWNADARVLLDAFTVVDLGPALVPATDCRVVDESETCGAHGLCLYGRCVDARLLEGTPPAGPHVDDYLARASAVYAAFEGGRIPRANLATFDAVLAPLVGAEADARFFPTLRRAIDGLADGHASGPYVSYPVRSAAGVCAHLGEADLLPEAGLAPLVFSTSGPNPISDAVQAGDALVAIDGIPALEWAALAGRLVSYSGDPAGRDVVIAPSLIDAALTAGSVLTFARCPADPLAPLACATSDVVVTELDLRELLGTLFWSGQNPAWRAEQVECDYRFKRPVEGEGVTDYAFAGTATLDGDVRALLINGVPGAYGEGEAWAATVSTLLDEAPARMLLDERLGSGGSIDAVDLLAGELLAPSDFARMELLPAIDQPLDDDTRAALASCEDTVGLGLCGAAFPWVLGETLGDRSTSSATKLAVLTSADVSGNDYVTKLVKYRAAPTRVFGPAPTYGAFGVIWQLPPVHGELVGGSFQVHDTLFLASSDDDNLDFQTAIGVPPDEIVYQRQSDAVRGEDTALNAALAWLTQP